jgi:alanine-glyoxylate transaminase/serine-glyoxylate transaminase/serine-pyruvate transaminase
MDYPTIDHRGAQFAEIGKKCLDGMKTIFKTESQTIIYPASGTGAWESALVNTLRDGDLVLMIETGHFASLWNKMAARLGIETEFLTTDWRRGVDPQQIEERLRQDTEQKNQRGLCRS